MKFSEWLPDQDYFENPGLVKANNVLPSSFYKPFKRLVSQTGTLGEVGCIGAFSTKDDDGESLNIAGTKTDLYSLISGTWTSATGGAKPYTTASEFRWVFKRFGDTIVATNRSNNIQKMDVSGGAFSDLGGSPPRAKFMAVVRDFLVLGNLNTGANKVQWSGLNDIEEWTPGNKESDLQTFPEGGPITGMIGGEYGLIFQENQITRMEYQGPPLNFSFDVIETGLGAIASGSIVRFGIQTFYLSNNGFYVTDGSRSYPIGSEKVDKYFFSRANELALHKMTSAVDPINKLVIWSYVSDDDATSNPDRLIIYNWDLKRWSEVSTDGVTDPTVKLEHQLIYTSLSEDYTLDELDGFGTLSQIDTPLDSRFWMGGSIILSAFDGDTKAASFTGEVLPATIALGELEINDLQRSIITQVWPEIDGAVDIKINSRESHQASSTSSGLIGTNSIGFAPFAHNGRYHQIEFSFSGWSRASGFKIKAEAAGEY